MAAKKPTYGKLPSQGFMNRNPNYRVAEHKLEGKSSGKGKPNVRPSNLDTFYAKQGGFPSERGYGGEVFAGESSAEGAAQRLADTGMRTGFGGRGIEPNRNLSPRERRQLGLGGNSGGTRTPAGPTDDQRKWAKDFRESQSRRADSSPSAADQGLGGAMSGSVVTPSTSGSQEPPNFSRSALVEGAKRSGDFDRVRGDYNKQSAAAQTGMRMNERGSIAPLNRTTAGADGMTPYAREKFGPAVEDIRARRDFATGKSTTTSGTTGLSSGMNSNPNADEMTPGTGGVRPTQAADFRREITSNYGRGSNVTRADGQAGGMMPDPLTGKQVPTRNALAEQSGVQDTKEGTSGRGENRTFNRAGEDYFNGGAKTSASTTAGGGSSSASAPARRSGGGSRK